VGNVPKVVSAPSQHHFGVERLGQIMSPKDGEPHEAWGVLNPGGVRAPDGTMHLFPRLVAEGNYSRIGHARVVFDEAGDKPIGVERLGVALEPHETYEVSSGGGGVEDPRVVYVPLIKRYVMTYTAFVPYVPKVAVAISEDLVTWRRLGVLRYARNRPGYVPELIGNKDAMFFPTPVRDRENVLSFAILHRPTASIRFHLGRSELSLPGIGRFKTESAWISYIPVSDVLADIENLTSVQRHEQVMSSQEPWEESKVGGGAPPVRLESGWLLTYHGVAPVDGHNRYCMGVAILDLERPSKILYRTKLPILEPETDYEKSGLVSNVVFPSATDRRPDGKLDVYYGAADHVIAAARVTLPSELAIPASSP
jgi:predicted GH43/DUF377 family glycosyl hydrolase